MIVFFDIGATLVDGPRETPARQLARSLALDDSSLRSLDKQLLTGAVSGREALVNVLVARYGGNPVEASAAVNAVLESQAREPVVVSGGRGLLDSLQRRGVPYGFISNIWQPYADRFLRLFGPLAADRYCAFSYRLGVSKPDSEIYRAALAATHVAPAHSVMIGDSYDNDMAPAMALGMRTIWLLHRPEKERSSTEKIAAGRLRPPDITLPSIDCLTVSSILQLMNGKNEAVP